MITAIQIKAALISKEIPEHWFSLVPSYQSRTYGGLILKMSWDRKYAVSIQQVSEKRARNRFANYIDPKEVARARSKLNTKGEASLRFGVAKPGHGYKGERGDFCLVGGVVRGRDLTVFYRSLELIGGFAYDLCLFRELEDLIDVPWKTVSIMASRANVFALKGNSNQKLYPKLVEIFSG